MRRLALIGLDCADPVLLQELLPELPTLRGLAERGCLTRLRSVDPPITVPAWMCMMTGKDPGSLGVYGFRNRLDHSYADLRIVDSTVFADAEPIWDTLARQGRRSILLGIPGTYPPRRVAGKLVSGPLTPSAQSTFTYPPSLRDDINRWIGEYLFDIPIGKTKGKLQIAEDIRTMTAQRFELARRLVVDDDWSFFAMVEMGSDRMHHAFWSDHDPTHPQHDAERPSRNAIRDFYRFLDGEIASLIQVLPKGTQLCVASDHGVQRLCGGIAINEWLISHGYLTLKRNPSKPTRLEELIKCGLVDWDRTQAWGAGGYYGRIFFNVIGREPHGAVPPQQYNALQEELVDALGALPDGNQSLRPTRVLRPATTYPVAHGIPPDLLAYFGDLSWRSIGTVGWGRVHLQEEDAGPGTANHALEGVFLSTPPLQGGNPDSIPEVRDALLKHFQLLES